MHVIEEALVRVLPCQSRAPHEFSCDNYPWLFEEKLLPTWINEEKLKENSVSMSQNILTDPCSFKIRQNTERGLFIITLTRYIYIYIKVKVKWSRYKPGVAQRVGRGIAVLFHDRGTWRGWVVSSTPRPHFTPGKEPVPTLLETGWAPGPVWTGGKSGLHRHSIPDRPALSQSLYRLSYPAHIYVYVKGKFGFYVKKLINGILCF